MHANSNGKDTQSQNAVGLFHSNQTHVANCRYGKSRKSQTCYNHYKYVIQS